MKFTFVLKDKDTKNQSWWLKISTIQELVKYHEIIDMQTCNKVTDSFLESKEFGYGMSHASPEAFAYGIYASNRGLSFHQAYTDIYESTLQFQMDELTKGNVLYFNANGAYYPSENMKDEIFIRSNNIIFPELHENDIRISKFPGGNHYYAYIGKLEVHDDNIIKWNSYEEAYKQALKFVHK